MKRAPNNVGSSRYRTTVVGLVALVVSLPSLFSSAAALASPRAFDVGDLDVRRAEVREYKREFGVSELHAEESLETQQTGLDMNLVAQLESLLGADYAGVWFDNATGDFVIPVTPGADRDAVVQSLFAAGLSGHFRFTPAQASWRQLQSTQNQINASLGEQLRHGTVETSLDPQTNAVLVKTADDIGSAGAARAQNLARGFQGEVELREGTARALSGQLEGCNDVFCGPSLRGGVQIFGSNAKNSEDSCTAGFRAVSPTGNRYLLTAGHCVVEIGEVEPATTTWYSKNDSLQTWKIGDVEQAVSPIDDWAKISVNGSEWDKGQSANEIVYYGEPIFDANGKMIGKSPTVDSNYAITGESSSVKGTFVCHSGIMTGTTCGQVTAVGVSHTWAGNWTINNLNEAVGVCSIPGDSGGPWFSGHIALGMHTGSVVESKTCSGARFYTDITRATSALGVSIASTAFPTPSEGEEDYSPGPRSTVDPTNNSVNVFYRTPSGSLGHRWHAPWESGWGSETLAGSVASEPHAIVDRDGGINVFYRTPSGTLGHNWWEAGGTGWGSESLGGSLAANAEPHAIVDSNKVVNVFYRTPSGSLGHRWHAPWESGWGSETLAGSVASEPHAIVDKDGGINVFYRTPSGTLGHNWWEAGGTGWGSESLGGSLAANAEPHAIVEPNNSVHVFYRTASGSLGHRWHAPWESGWGSETLAGSLDSSAEPHAIVDKNGGVNVFYRTPSGTLGHNWWEVGNNVWGSEDLGGSLASEPHAIVDPTNNSVNVFYRTPSGSLGHRWHAPWESGWGSETLAGSLSSEPHLIVDRNGGINVFYRTPSGTLGHNWWEAGGTGWGSESLGGSLAPTPPSATTGAASGVGANEAKLEGTVNPNGSPTSYYFEYGPTTSYGSKAPASAAEAGYGTAAVAVSQALSGLSPSTTYHYRLVATGPEGTATGQDKTFATKAATVASQLAALPVTEPFDGSSGSLANFGSKWSTLGWAAGGSPKGADTTTGWGPVNAFSTINGAYFNTSVSAGGLGSAVVATMAVNPGLTERHFSLWLNMSTPGGTKAGYELRFQNTAANAYEVRLLKWVGASEAQLASKTGYSFSNGSSFALVDQGATVSAWTDTGSGFAQQLSAADSAFSSGYAGLQGAGSTTRLRNFKAGGI